MLSSYSTSSFFQAAPSTISYHQRPLAIERHIISVQWQPPWLAALCCKHWLAACVVYVAGLNAQTCTPCHTDTPMVDNTAALQPNHKLWCFPATIHSKLVILGFCVSNAVQALQHLRRMHAELEVGIQISNCPRHSLQQAQKEVTAQGQVQMAEVPWLGACGCQLACSILWHWWQVAIQVTYSTK